MLRGDMTPDPKRIRSFENAAAFEAWLAKNHLRERELWLKIHKKGSGLASVTAAEAIDVGLCWGWIDGLRKGFDDRSFLQRYTPRKARSLWSQINRDHVARLTAAGRMTEHGQRQVDAAKADGRWDAAYAPIRSASVANIPTDLREAIDANPSAKKTFATLNRMNLFALAFRTNNMKTTAGRARKIAVLVELLARGEVIVPIAAGRKRVASAARSTTPDAPAARARRAARGPRVPPGHALHSSARKRSPSAEEQLVADESSLCERQVLTPGGR